MDFQTKRKLAEKKYGVASERPQDVNRELMKKQIFKNTVSQFPDTSNYGEELCRLKYNTSKLTPPKYYLKFEGKSIWVDSDLKVQDFNCEMVRSNVIAIDFEFHDNESFDGK